MEALATYLMKSSVWLTGFALVYALFLRNERFFTLNRIYLVSGILISIIFPFFTWHYTVVLPVVPSIEVSDPQVQGIVVPEEHLFTTQNFLLLLYLSGISYLIFRIIRQTLPVFRIIRKSETHPYRSAKLIRTDAYPASFSFFSFVFVNPSIDETETNEIVNHELEHIRQQHWIDLLLYEILRTMQWFNPVSWLYGHLIRQNHEYLADEHALQHSSNPAIYRAALLNQMFGGPVISLANSFNYSLNKKRFNMMKQTISSPIRKLKLFIVFPLMAGVFYAFAAPEYKFVQDENSTVLQISKTVTGRVISEDGKPLKGATIVVSGKTIGTTTDAEGRFKLEMPDDSPIVISFVGFESQKVNPDYEKEMVITMKIATIGIEPMGNNVSTSQSQTIPKTSLIIIDGKEATKAEMDKINPDKIEKVEVLKNKTSVEKYGEKGKDGVVLITLKPEENSSNTQTFKIKSDAPFKFENPEGFGTQPLIVKDGVIAPNQDVNNIPPETIESISILKGESATKKYGKKGKNGVVEITTKNSKKGTVTKLSGNFVKYASKDATPPTSGLNFRANKLQGDDKNGMSNIKADTISIDFSKTNSLLFIDGKESTKAEVDQLKPDKIESVSVLKGESATRLYGEKGKDGVILITMKKSGTITTTGTTDVKVTGYANDQKKNQSTSGIQIRSTGTSETESKPLIVINGVIAENQDMNKIDPETIGSINVLKNKSAMKKYGDKAKNGVVEIALKKASDTFIIVEEMPSFPGGVDALRTFVSSTMKYPFVALENGIYGQVIVGFVVSKTGKIINTKVSRRVDPSLDKEALRIVNSMPKWNPGKQNGEAVDVAYEIPINFKVPADYHPKSREQLRTARSTANSYTKATYTKSRPDSKESKANPAIDPTNQKILLTIVPNPTSDDARITLDGPESTNKLEISVYDSSGKLIKNASKNGQTFSLSINNLPPGSYLVVGKDVKNELTVTGQLVVNH